MKIDWINSWKAGNKKEKYHLSFRLGTLTVFEIKACLFCDGLCSNQRFRFILLNFGFQF